VQIFADIFLKIFSAVMKNIDLKAFRKANLISQVELAEYLGVGQSFISQVEKGIRPLPKEYISKLLANSGWDISMLTEPKNPMTDQPKEQSLVDYLQRQVADKDALIRELYKQIGILEEKLDSARKGETASHVGTSSAAHVG
jgi:transcriptional regulator with XRE-family HTH domain